jgi:hypothetical protein
MVINGNVEGVGKTPSKDDLVQGLAENSTKFLPHVGPDMYLDFLCDISKSFSSLSDKSKTILRV